MIKSQLESKPGREKQKQKKKGSPVPANARNVQKQMDAGCAYVYPPRKGNIGQKTKKETMERTTHENPESQKTAKTKENPQYTGPRIKITPEPKVSVVSNPASRHQSQSSPNTP
jgi:hypothetical protein